MGTTEAPAQAEVIVRAFEMGFALWRNNSGVAREKHRHVRFGLGNDSAKINKFWKSGDLVGVGPNGRFLMLEIKHPKWVFGSSKSVRIIEHENAQANAINQVNSLGGIAFFCTSVEEFERVVRSCMTQ